MKEQIQDVMKRVFKVAELPENPTQENVEQWDSLHHLNLMVEIEIEFDTEFEPEDIAKMKSLEAICETINSKK